MTLPDPGRDHLLQALDAQGQDYGLLYRASLEQRDCLRRDDLPGANAAGERVRALIDRVRLRQAHLPADLPGRERGDPAVAERVDALRRAIQSVLEVRGQSEAAARRLLEETRCQLRRVDTGRRASRGYRPQAARGARFVDGAR